MPRESGHRLTDAARDRAIRMLENFIASGIPDGDARDEIIQRFNVSARSARRWVDAAYKRLGKEAEVDRRLLVGSALRTRRLILARAMKNADFRLALACADSISRLTGLDAPSRSQLSIVTEQVADVTKAMTETIRTFFADDAIGRGRFVQLLRAQVDATLGRRRDAKIVIDVDPDSPPPEAIEAGESEPVSALDVATSGPTADVAPTAAPAPDDPPPA